MSCIPDKTHIHQHPLYKVCLIILSRQLHLAFYIAGTTLARVLIKTYKTFFLLIYSYINTSGKTRNCVEHGKFSVLTLSYINTAFSQSVFRIYKCYIIDGT